MKKLILVDGNSIMYRAYYGTAMGSSIMQNSQGLYTNAVYAFVNMITTIMKEEYDYFLVAFDAGKKTFRHDLVSDYKAGRAVMPDEFRIQIPYIKKFLDVINVKRYEMPLYEADDIIGTLSMLAKQENIITTIYSSDKDLLQLVDDNCFVNLCKKGIGEVDHYDKDAIVERYGLTNKQMIDLKALMGDPSDNLKGIQGVGEKTAIKLLSEYGSLENLIENRDKIKGKLGEKIESGYKDALICQKMCTINRNSPIEISLEDTVKKDYDVEELRKFYLELEFHSLVKKMKAKDVVLEYQKIDQFCDMSDILVDDSAIYLELDGTNYHKANIIGMGVVNEKGNFFIPSDILLNSMEVQMYLEEENHKTVFGMKKIIVALKRIGINIRGIDFDTLLASYVIDPSIGKEDLIIIARTYGYDDLLYDENIYGKGAKYTVPSENIYAPHIVKKAMAIRYLRPKMDEKLGLYQQRSLLFDVEMPLACVLARMEEAGMKVSVYELNRQKELLKEKIDDIENQIYNMAGYQFNISSTKQLAELLFVERSLPCSKKTKTGYSTDSSVLECLVDLDPIVSLVLEYRALTKLFSTYIDGIETVLFSDSKVHTIFEQALTQTGRLSSIEPNLQNIPIRTSLGKEIRKMFIPSYDLLLSADYSQIELRVLAHMANVKKLIEAFKNGDDIHSQTASHVFETTNVTKELRQRAKAVNFGIIYGISTWGLANDIHISNTHAKEIIEKYLNTYPEIKEFMDKMKDDAKENGYVLTILNRRRYIPELSSPNFNVREFGKRTAMNAPIQGSAADLIKLAMINIDKEIQKRKLKSKMISQVHDELIFDVVLEEKDTMIEIIREKMLNVIDLRVPLEIDYGYGKNWYEVK